VLTAALPGQGTPSHAYLFFGPAGTGKREIARAFAAELLADGAPDPDAVRARVQRGSHPDLTWVSPSGASEMLVADIEQPVVAAAAHTPFEAARRVFVIEDVDAMNDQAANRMLKTLEEPAAFAHLLLLSDRREDVLPTIASRCQQVRFDPPPASAIAERLTGIEPQQALACARLAGGDAGMAARLCGEGAALREAAEALVAAALAGATGDRPWLALLELARAAGAADALETDRETELELELLPARERKRFERERQDARRRGERRERTRTLDEALRLVELWLRDMLCIREGAGELVHAVDRREQLERDAAAAEPDALREAIARVSDVRLSLSVNVSEELALESLAYSLEELLG
jgi:DNA polymerase-3 subunit delta'